MPTLCLPWAGIQEEEAVAIGAGNRENEGVWWEQGKRVPRPTSTFRSFAASDFTFVSVMPYPRHIHSMLLLSLQLNGDGMGRVTRQVPVGVL
jgi:hypothetical protein